MGHHDFSIVGQSQEASMTIQVQADPSRMITVVKYLSQDCFPRSEKEEYEKAALLIEEHFTKSGLDVSRQEYLGKYNLLGFKKGKTNRRIIVGAHYDSVEVTPGADDNASGIAVLIELAYLLQRASQPDCDVELVAWNSEEPPYFMGDTMGSYVHADSLKKSIQEENVEVLALLCMDLVGYYSDEANSQRYPIKMMNLLYGDKGDFLTVTGLTRDAKLIHLVKEIINDKAKLKTHTFDIPEELSHFIAFSDHINYWNLGVPVAFLTDTAFYRNPNYHQKTDTWETLDYDKMAKLANGLYQVIQSIDKTPTRIKNTP